MVGLSRLQFGLLLADEINGSTVSVLGTSRPIMLSSEQFSVSWFNSVYYEDPLTHLSRIPKRSIPFIDNQMGWVFNYGILGIYHLAHNFCKKKYFFKVLSGSFKGDPYLSLQPGS